MNPTPTYAGVLAEALVAALNPQLATMARSQLASKIEAETVRWIGERFGWQQPFDGTFTSGGNEANFSGLALALAHHFPSAIEEGVASIGAQPVAYTSEEAHHSLDKSVGLLGLGRKALRRIAVTDRIQLDLAALQSAIREDRAAGRKPFCVVATAGTTNSGAIDDIAALAEICQRENLWLHLDGAYGASAVFSNTHRHLVRGIERCDSVTIDPHKWLAMPFAAGVILTRHPQTLQQAFGVSTPYMPKTSHGLPTRQLQGQHAVDAPHELAQALAHAKTAWPPRVRTAHRPPDGASRKLCRPDSRQRALRADRAHVRAHPEFPPEATPAPAKTSSAATSNLSTMSPATAIAGSPKHECAVKVFFA